MKKKKYINVSSDLVQRILSITVGRKVMWFTKGNNNEDYCNLISELLEAIENKSLKFKSGVKDPKKKLGLLLEFFQFLDQEKMRLYFDSLKSVDKTTMLIDNTIFDNFFEHVIQDDMPF